MLFPIGSQSPQQLTRLADAFGYNIDSTVPGKCRRLIIPVVYDDLLPVELGKQLGKLLP